MCTYRCNQSMKKKLPTPPAALPGSARRLALAALVALTACGGGASAPAASPALPSPVDRLLDASEIESVIGQRAGYFTRQVALLAGDLTDEELERLVNASRAGFEPDLLRRDVADFLAREAPEGRIDEILSWMEGGSSAEARRIMDAYEPPLPLSDWLGEYTADPPPATRIRLVAHWTDARGTGDFFVLMQEALAEAAFSSWAVLRPGDAPDFTPLGGADLSDRLESSFNAAVVSTLHAGETVPDSVVRSATAELETEAGQWYVQNYQLAVAEAMRAAGRRVADALRG